MRDFMIMPYPRFNQLSDNDDDNGNYNDNDEDHEKDNNKDLNVKDDQTRDFFIVLFSATFERLGVFQFVVHTYLRSSISNYFYLISVKGFLMFRFKYFF